ncbi:LasR-specific antiactivator QslA [Pseudomonas nitroreducens]|uniref:LasR-specific antiactivator QslA n=1 Tax=Pseudomonas nitroreducens TaxID=46680 RepID=UPI00209D0614|nr:LasR-specific antiactivator QslA [Pseudomonas nitroreducens]MCP1625875.1 hypothetical protein [Pseudomonas nitroreducens]
MNVNPTSLEHLRNAQRSFDSLYGILRKRGDTHLLPLLQKLMTEAEEAYWMADLGQRCRPSEIPPLPFCRRIPLTPVLHRHLDSLRHGMHEAQNSMKPQDRSAPWNALFSMRQTYPNGAARLGFETGFVIRLFQLLLDAQHGAGRWSFVRTQPVPLQ